MIPCPKPIKYEEVRAAVLNATVDNERRVRLYRLVHAFLMERVGSKPTKRWNAPLLALVEADELLANFYRAVVVGADGQHLRITFYLTRRDPSSSDWYHTVDVYGTGTEGPFVYQGELVSRAERDDDCNTALKARLPGLEEAVKRYNAACEALNKAAEFAAYADTDHRGRAFVSYLYPLSQYFRSATY